MKISSSRIFAPYDFSLGTQPFFEWESLFQVSSRTKSYHQTLKLIPVLELNKLDFVSKINSHKVIFPTRTESTSGQKFVKTCILNAAEVVCPKKKTSFANISLIRNTVADLVTELSSDLNQQSKEKIKSFIPFSIVLK